ncbi:MAG: carboxypeptidase-like regulatory domain-containing protein [Planctomycetaceae bacterium]|jgi:hypothetical protein|nr:carboxypeptidase-like regulatory domain-containing protein [Planctomycetaceae bacterium]
MLKIITSILLLILLIGLSGCNKEHRPAGLPKLIPCEITVINTDGTPLADALVRLVAIETPIPWAIIDKTDENGIANIFVNAKYQGSPVGKFRVLISKNEGFDKTLGTPKTPPNAYVSVDAELIYYVNPIYSNEKLSPFEIEVIDNKLFSTTLTLVKKPSENVR